MRTLNFAKGQGTLNDFVIIPDRGGINSLSASDVQFICNRRTGIGADGLLRAVAVEHTDCAADPELWFMDYRNADGSIAEMCGNGLRVFVQYLIEEGLVPRDRVRVATRAGCREVTALPDGRLRAELGAVRLIGETHLKLAGRTYPAHHVDVGNPHAVVYLDSVSELEALHLSTPELDPSEFPAGANVEFVVQLEPGKVRLRVFERGAGETFSCGTGVVAAAAVARENGGPDRCQVQVKGGQLSVELGGTGAYLTGAAEIVARGQLNLPTLGER